MTIIQRICFILSKVVHPYKYYDILVQNCLLIIGLNGNMFDPVFVQCVGKSHYTNVNAFFLFRLCLVNNSAYC